MSFSSRLQEITRKYGKVALAVHLSVSVASVTGLYVAVRNNVDVEALFQKAGLSSPSSPPPSDSDPTATSNDHPRNRTAELAASSGGALAVAILLNKALFPVRVPITIALTPPISRFLRKRNLL
ncbi:hypothetical protein J5N97_022761 [Dioscorea zingiberensis]|uniref:DUF1279 domain-containing protein n=1 Tax=Dioscorea zingiberensis TaxID=325984 RepID=A0A9D5CBC9_9LILI|nr:hypothetical protein J5N97_022761 [Dioscorea zingiberensis]